MKSKKTSKKANPPLSPSVPSVQIKSWEKVPFLRNYYPTVGTGGNGGGFFRRGMGDCLFFALDSAGLALMSSLYLEGWALFALCMVEVLTCIAPLKVLSGASSLPLPCEGASNNCDRN